MAVDGKQSRANFARLLIDRLMENCGCDGDQNAYVLMKDYLSQMLNDYEIESTNLDKIDEECSCIEAVLGVSPPEDDTPEVPPATHEIERATPTL